METILKIEDVKKRFGKKEILKGISLSVYEGEIISVLGPSGCGKSTLLNIIAGILPLDEGSVYIKGKEVSGRREMVPAQKRNLNMVFQDFALWPHMKARDNILYGLRVQKVRKEEFEERFCQVVSLLHLEGLMDQYPSELSGGQQQRVAIARALITKPAIVLLDEPLCNLDIQLRIEMRTEMAQLFHSLRTSVFHVTHDPSEAFAMADRIIVMNGGTIDQMDTPKVCYTMPKTSMVAGLLGAGNCLEKGRFVQMQAKYCQGGQEEIQSVTASCVIQIGESRLTGMCFLKEPAEKIQLRFRPEECLFSDENSIPVTVVMSSFEGGICRVKVETEEGECFCLLHKEFLSSGRKGYANIAEEKLYVYETDCY